MKRKPKRTKSGKFKADGRKNKRPRKRNPSTSVARSSNPARKSKPRRSSNGPRRSSNPTRRSNPARRSSNPSPNPKKSGKGRRRRRNPDMGPVGKLVVAGLIGAVGLVGVTMAATYAQSRNIAPPVIAGGVAALSGGVAYGLRNYSPPASLAIAGVGIGAAGLMGWNLLTAPKEEKQAGPAFQAQGGLAGLHAASMRAVEQVVGAHGFPETDMAPYASSADLGLYS